MKICAIIPSHNHYEALPNLLRDVLADIPDIFIVDDGSDEPARSAIACLHAPDKGVVVSRLAKRSGKGRAVSEGFRQANRAHFTHAFQIDADGQHDLKALPGMLALAKANPRALISGRPIFDASIPTARKIGRWITHVWVWIETLSFQIPDSMCGFRIYPLAAAMKSAATRPFASHMDFDTDIMVRLFWEDVPLVFQPVGVVYPPGNISNFDAMRDNVRISWMHTKLVTHMLLHLPSTVLKKARQEGQTAHWSKLAERGTYHGLRITAAFAILLGKKASLVLLTPITLYFYLTGTRQRRASRTFLTRAFGRKPTRREGYRNLSNFVERSLDVFLALIGRLPAETVVPLNQTTRDFLENSEGSMIVVAHIGNANIAHALLTPAQRNRMVVLAHTKHAASFNSILKEFSPSTCRQPVRSDRNRAGNSRRSQGPYRSGRPYRDRR